MKIILLKIKKGKLKRWLKWCLLLKTKYYSEAENSLKEECLIYESCALFELENDHYVLGFSMSMGEGKPANMDKDVNKLHQKYRKECLELVNKPSILYEFKEFK